MAYKQKRNNMPPQDQNPVSQPFAPIQPTNTPPAPQAPVVSGGAPVTPAPAPVFQPVSFSDNPFTEESSNGVRPIAVVQVLSPRGVEYVLLTLLLFIGAFSLMGTIITVITTGFDFSSIAFPLANLLLSLPLFAFLFLRLKNAELENDDLKLDPSKRRSTQFTQVFSFLLTFFSFTGIIYTIFLAIAGDAEGAWKAIASAFVICAVSGGIFAYYWIDEHKN